MGINAAAALIADAFHRFERLSFGIVSLDGAIEHGKQGHSDLAKKSAEEAVKHLKAAQ